MNHLSPTFRTLCTATPSDLRIRHGQWLMSIGSCFSEGIGKRFSEGKFQIDINPFGQQYNPFSLANAIERMIRPVPYHEADLHFHNGLYHSFDHHGNFSHDSVEKVLDHCNTRLARASEVLSSCRVLFITLGTAHVFRWRKTGKVVSNCHRFPNTEFEVALIGAQAIVERMREVLAMLRQVNPACRVVFTVSPVRYLAMGMFENSVSKAQLFTAVHTLLADGHCYFPAYELVVDDLRDYRFYASDMVHPSAQAADYVWQHLAAAYFDPDTQTVLERIGEVQAAARHRPRHPEGEAHRMFCDKFLQKARQLEEEYGVDMEEERLLLGRPAGGGC